MECQGIHQRAIALTRRVLSVVTTLLLCAPVAAAAPEFGDALRTRSGKELTVTTKLCQDGAPCLVDVPPAQEGFRMKVRCAQLLYEVITVRFVPAPQRVIPATSHPSLRNKRRRKLYVHTRFIRVGARTRGSL